MLLDHAVNLLFYFSSFSFSDAYDNKPCDSNAIFYANMFDENNNATIKKHTASSMADSGGANLYMVHSEDQSFVIKFENTERIKNEANALRLLQETTIAPTLLGQGQFLKDKDTTGVLIESFVQGRSLNQHLEKLGKSYNPFSYLIYKYRLSKALESFAEKLSHFHSLNIKPIHNDLHPGNIFYDSAHDKSTIIDYEQTSFNKQKPEEDIAYFLLTFEMYASKFKLKPELIDSLKTTFLKTYNKPLDQKLINECKKHQIDEFLEHFDSNGNDEEKQLLAFLEGIKDQ